MFDSLKRIMNKILYSIIFFIITLSNTGLCNSFYINDSLEDAVLIAQDTQQPILVVFTADWCKFCNIMKKDIDQNIKDFDTYIICYVNTEKRSDLTKEYQVKTIPDYFVLKNNIESKRKVGYSNYHNFTDWLNR
jgi:thioredoxin 1